MLVVFISRNIWPILRESGLILVQLGLQNGRWDIIDRRGDGIELYDWGLGASRSVTWKRVIAG